MNKKLIKEANKWLFEDQKTIPVEKIMNILDEIFQWNVGDSKYFKNVVGKENYDEETTTTKISGIMEGEYFTKYFGEPTEENIGKTEQELERSYHSYTGPGQQFRNVYISIEPVNDGSSNFNFNITVNNSLDI